MDRKEFLSLIGGTAAVFAIGGTLQSCRKKTPSSNSIDFTLNLSDPAYSALNHNGGYLYANGVIVARTNSGSYIAVSEYCTHAGSAVVYQSSSNNFYCPSHGSSFSAGGSVTAGPASSGLQLYNTSLSGTNLRVYS